MSDALTLRLDDRAVIEVAGPDARTFLHRLLTQDVATLEAGALRYAALLTPQGRVLHDLFLFGEADAIRIDVARTSRDALVQRLAAFRLRAAVTVEPREDAVSVLWKTATAPTPWRRDPRTPLAGFRSLGDAPAPDAAEASREAYRMHRLSLGLPDVAQDGLGDRVYATEADLDLLDGVDYRKGCFVGQETTSRMKRRGGIRSRILPLDFEADAPSAGTEVLTGELRVGEIVATAGRRALALLRLDRIGSGGLVAAGSVAILALPAWAPADLFDQPSAKSPSSSSLGAVA